MLFDYLTILLFDNLQFTGAHIVLENNRSTNLVNQRLVLAGFLLQSPLQHSLMSQYRGEALVKKVYRNIGASLAPTIDELLHALQILAGLTIGLTRFSNDNTLDGFLGNILRKELE